MTKWLYKIIQFEKGILGTIDKLGIAGWEMCGIHNDIVFLKRPLNDLTMHESNTRKPLYKLEVNPCGDDVREVDLEKEVEHWRNMMPVIIGKKWLNRFARHFYELGKSAN